MKIVIMGSGGLGSYIGGRLAQGGKDVTLIARGTHLEALRKDGLTIGGALGEARVREVSATDNPADLGPADVVILAVKTYDLGPATEALRPLVGEDTAVIPLLNGIEHIETLSDALGAGHVLGGSAVITVHRTAPGVVELIGEHASLEFGEAGGGDLGRCKAIARALEVDGFKVAAVPNIMDRMWYKFAIICGAGLFSVVRTDKETLWRAPEAVALFRRAVEETVATARANGIRLADTFPQQTTEMFAGLPPHFKPSMLVDVEAGRRIELEALNGALSRIAAESGVPAPVNDFIYACLKPYCTSHERPE